MTNCLLCLVIGASLILAEQLCKLFLDYDFMDLNGCLVKLQLGGLQDRGNIYLFILGVKYPLNAGIFLICQCAYFPVYFTFPQAFLCLTVMSIFGIVVLFHSWGKPFPVRQISLSAGEVIFDLTTILLRYWAQLWPDLIFVNLATLPELAYIFYCNLMSRIQDVTITSSNVSLSDHS